jgi:hypothetical protein
MAKIYKANGEVLDIEPKNGTDFKLEELQAIVGGLIDCQMTNDGKDLIVFNDEGNSWNFLTTIMQQRFTKTGFMKETSWLAMF